MLGVFSDTLHLENEVFIADSLTDLFIAELVDDKLYGVDKFSGAGLVKSEKLFADTYNLFITGGFEGELILGPDTLISTGDWYLLWPGADSIYKYTEHLFLIKYNLGEKLIWYKNYENVRSLSVAQDNSHNLYLVAYHYGECLIEDDIKITDNLFLLKYDENGKYLWHLTGGPSGQITQPYDLICCDNHLYITGHIAVNILNRNRNVTTK